MKPGIPYPSKTIEDELKEDGYGHEVIKRAKKALAVQSVQTASGWTWTLPILPLRCPPHTIPSTDTNASTDTTASTDTPDLKTVTYTPEVGVVAVEAVEAEVAVAGICPGGPQEKPPSPNVSPLPANTYAVHDTRVIAHQEAVPRRELMARYNRLWSH